MADKKAMAGVTPASQAQVQAQAAQAAAQAQAARARAHAVKQAQVQVAQAQAVQAAQASQVQVQNKARAQEALAKSQKKEPIDEKSLIATEILATLRNQGPLLVPWNRYDDKRKKVFEEYTSRLVWLVDEEVIRQLGIDRLAMARTDIGYMVVEMRKIIPFYNLRSAKCVAALLTDGSVMLSTADGRAYWGGNPVASGTEGRGFQRFAVGDESMTMVSMKEYDDAMAAGQVSMVAYESEFGDYVCKYRHDLGGLRWEDMNSQLENFANRRGVKQPERKRPHMSAGPPPQTQQQQQQQKNANANTNALTPQQQLQQKQMQMQLEKKVAVQKQKAAMQQLQQGAPSPMVGVTTQQQQQAMAVQKQAMGTTQAKGAGAK